MKRQVLYLSFIICNLWPRGTAAQVQNDLLPEIKRAYEALNFQEVEIKAEAVFENYSSYSSEELTEIHKILAFVFFSQNQPVRAREQFLLALSLKPDLHLDSLLVSPKILDFFESVKESRLTDDAASDETSAKIRYVMLSDPRPDAVLRSMVLPGWGQLYKKQKGKGVIMASLWAAGVTGTIVFHFARQNAEDKYLAEIEPTEIESRYQTFNRYHKLRNGFVLLSAATWLFSYFDAFLTKTDLPQIPTALNFEPGLNGKIASVQLSLRF